MNMTPSKTTEFIKALAPEVAAYNEADIVLCVPFVNIPAAVEAAKNGKTIPLHTFGGSVEHALAHIEEALHHSLPAGQERWYSVKLFERDSRVQEYLGLSPETIAHIEEDIASCERELDDDAESMYFISTLPWLHYTQLIQPVACGEESNPRFTWGKYQPDDQGRMMMPLSVLVHHALADGIHIAQFYEAFDKQTKLICEEA